MKELLNKRINDLATENYAVLRLFLEYKIDFYCKGDRVLKDVISNSELDKEIFLKKLEETLNQPKSHFEVQIEEWPLDLLADYIQKTHHRYTDQTLVTLKKMTTDYIENNLAEIDKMKEFQIPLELLAKELGGHMKKEELILFPFIKKLIINKGKFDSSRIKSAEDPIEMMIHEHDTAFNLLEKIQIIFDRNSQEELPSQEYKDIVQLMSELHQDLVVHIHLENNILFPKVLELEKIKVNL